MRTLRLASAADALHCLAQAWVLGALQSDSPRPYYYAAALYALPLLRNGLELDWFSWALLLVGIVHIQVRRHAAATCCVATRVCMPAVIALTRMPCRACLSASWHTAQLLRVGATEPDLQATLQAALRPLPLLGSIAGAAGSAARAAIGSPQLQQLAPPGDEGRLMQLRTGRRRRTPRGDDDSSDEAVAAARQLELDDFDIRLRERLSSKEEW